MVYIYNYILVYDTPNITRRFKFSIISKIKTGKNRTFKNRICCNDICKEVEGNEGMGGGGRGGSYICEKNIKNVLGKVLYINYPLLSMKPFF